MARGCIRQRSKGSWQLIWDEPTPDGSRKQRSKTITGTKRDAEREMTEISRSLNNGLYTPPTRQTLGEYLGGWMEGAASTLGVTSAARYAKVVDQYLVPTLGAYALQSLRPGDIRSAYDQWIKAGLSPRTIRLHHAVLHRALAEAVKQETLGRNPASAVAPPAVVSSGRRVSSNDDLQELLDKARGKAIFPPLALVICTGMRAGEICGLAWEDVDLVNKWLTVGGTAVRVNRGIIVKAPKTAGSRRSLALPTLAVEALEMLPRWGDWCFARRNGEPKDPSVLSREIKAFCGQGAHAFRHAHASFLMRQGIHPKEVADRLGHSKSSFTMDEYSHMMQDQRTNSARSVDETLR